MQHTKGTAVSPLKSGHHELAQWLLKWPRGPREGRCIWSELTSTQCFESQHPTTISAKPLASFSSGPTEGLSHSTLIFTLPTETRPIRHRDAEAFLAIHHPYAQSENQRPTTWTSMSVGKLRIKCTQSHIRNEITAMQILHCHFYPKTGLYCCKIITIILTLNLPVDTVSLFSLF